MLLDVIFFVTSLTMLSIKVLDEGVIGAGVFTVGKKNLSRWCQHVSLSFSLSDVSLSVLQLRTFRLKLPMGALFLSFRVRVFQTIRI